MATSMTKGIGRCTMGSKLPCEVISPVRSELSESARMNPMMNAGSGSRLAIRKNPSSENASRTHSWSTLLPEKRQEYVEHHRTIWPDVLAALEAAGHRNY